LNVAVTAVSRSAARPVSQGSGFFISEDGYSSPTTTSSRTARFTIVMDDGRELDAKLVGTDPRTDLALLKVEAHGKFTYVDFADDAKVRVGDWVVAVGNPFGLGGTVTAGIVSARGRDIGAGPYDDFIQIDAAVNRGNSGGPAFNLNGEVVGINTAIFSPSGGNVGIAFAIPASTAKEVVGDLMKDGSVQRGWLGVQIQPVTPEIADSLGLTASQGRARVRGAGRRPGARRPASRPGRHHRRRRQGRRESEGTRAPHRRHRARQDGRPHGLARRQVRDRQGRRSARCRAPTQQAAIEQPRPAQRRRVRSVPDLGLTVDPRRKTARASS
jgi:S1-C subfamily serine protease